MRYRCFFFLTLGVERGGRGGKGASLGRKGGGVYSFPLESCFGEAPTGGGGADRLGKEMPLFFTPFLQLERTAGRVFDFTV